MSQLPVVDPLLTRTSMRAQVPVGDWMLHDGIRLLAENPVDCHGDVQLPLSYFLAPPETRGSS